MVHLLHLDRYNHKFQNQVRPQTQNYYLVPGRLEISLNCTIVQVAMGTRLWYHCGVAVCHCVQHITQDVYSFSTGDYSRSYIAQDQAMHSCTCTTRVEDMQSNLISTPTASLHTIVAGIHYGNLWCNMPQLQHYNIHNTKESCTIYNCIFALLHAAHKDTYLHKLFVIMSTDT